MTLLISEILEARKKQRFGTHLDRKNLAMLNLVFYWNILGLKRPLAYKHCDFPIMFLFGHVNCLWKLRETLFDKYSSLIGGRLFESYTFLF